MNLPRIRAPKTVTVPPVEEKTFPDLFIAQLLIQSSPGGTMEATIRTVPYNHDTKEAGPESHQRLIHLRDLEAMAESRAAEGKPVLARALAGVVEAVDELLAEDAAPAGR